MTENAQRVFFVVPKCLFTVRSVLNLPFSCITVRRPFDSH